MAALGTHVLDATCCTLQGGGGDEQKVSLREPIAFWRSSTTAGQERLSQCYTPKVLCEPREVQGPGYAQKLSVLYRDWQQCCSPVSQVSQFSLLLDLVSFTNQVCSGFVAGGLGGGANCTVELVSHWFTKKAPIRKDLALTKVIWKCSTPISFAFLCLPI